MSRKKVAGRKRFPVAIALPLSGIYLRNNNHERRIEWRISDTIQQPISIQSTSLTGFSITCQLPLETIYSDSHLLQEPPPPPLYERVYSGLVPITRPFATTQNPTLKGNTEYFLRSYIEMRVCKQVDLWVQTFDCFYKQ